MKRKFKLILDQFNIKKEADELGVKVWQAPSFLFIIMGIVIVVVMTGVYYAAKIYDSPELLVISESLVVAILFTIGNSIIKSVVEIARANKMKTEFVSIASHQLKTPLSEINWEIELLVSKFSKGLTVKQKNIIEEIGKSNRKMVRLVNDLLDVARIDQGRLALNSEKIDLVEIAEDVVNSNKILASSNRVRINLKTKGRIKKAIGDKRKIWVVMDNLISNGIKYIEKRGLVDVLIAMEKDFVKVTVTDNGVGIPKAQNDQIFQKFFRIDNEAKNKTEGTGLGLYISKNIIENSGGTIGFESVENVGSKFFFLLPTKLDKKKKRKNLNY
jgi:signal transduction histidine kinase